MSLLMCRSCATLFLQRIPLCNRTDFIVRTCIDDNHDRRKHFVHFWSAGCELELLRRFPGIWRDDQIIWERIASKLTFEQSLALNRLSAGNQAPVYADLWR